jgi:hypothetical protein
VLASTFGVLLALPVAALLEPPVSVEIPISQVGARSVLSVDQDNGAKSTIGMTGKVSQAGLGRISASTLLRAGWAVGATLFLVPLVAALWRLRRARASAHALGEG